MRFGRIAAVLLVGVVLTLLVPSQADAQGFGIKGGLAMASLRSSTSGELDLNFSSFNRKSTFSGGIFLNIPLAVGFSLQPEGIYQKRRSGINFDNVPEDADFENYFEADYIEVPLLLRWRLGAGGSGFVIFGGPAVAFRMNAKAVERIGEEQGEEDIKELTNSTDIGAVFGLGVQISKIGIEGRYNLGFSNFLKESDNVSLKWGTISVLASLRF